MKLKNEIYDVLKWIGLVAIPAVAWFIGQVGYDIGIANADVVVKILNAVGTLLGMLIGVSTFNYNKEKDAEKDAEE